MVSAKNSTSGCETDANSTMHKSSGRLISGLYPFPNRISFALAAWGTQRRVSD